MRYLADRRARHAARNTQAQWQRRPRPSVDRTAVDHARADQYHLDQARLVDEQAYQRHQADLRAHSAYTRGVNDATDHVATQAPPATYDITGPTAAAAAAAAAATLAHDLPVTDPSTRPPRAYDVVPSTDITDLRTGINTIEPAYTPTPTTELAGPSTSLNDTGAVGLDT
ncbi:hypothetical protein [Corynebacterium bovis]|uniref:hypothetical protein n=1 Tax=Corynebacterium bovis TaxID=36808 RepID=UPI00313A479F